MRAGARAAAAALGLGAAYAGAVAWARRPLGDAPPEVALEAMEDRRLAAFGGSGTHRYLSTRQGRLHVLELGHGGPPLVVLPGLGASGVAYGALACALSRDHRVVLVDRPGCGLSDPVRPGVQPRSAWNQVVEEVAASLELERFDLLGHSLGGLAAGGFAVDHPDRVRGLVLMAPVGIATTRPASWAATMIPGSMDLLSALDRSAMARRQRRGDPDVRGLGWSPVQVGPDPEGHRLAVSRRFQRDSDLVNLPRLMTAFGFRPQSLLLPGLGLLGERTLVLWGDRDSRVELGPAREQLASYPRIRLEVLPGRSHLFPFDEAVETAARVDSWLGAVGA